MLHPRDLVRHALCLGHSNRRRRGINHNDIAARGLKQMQGYLHVAKARLADELMRNRMRSLEPLLGP